MAFGSLQNFVRVKVITLSHELLTGFPKWFCYDPGANILWIQLKSVFNVNSSNVSYRNVINSYGFLIHKRFL